MNELDGLINYWESVLKEFTYILGPSTLFLIQSTIKHLKKLQSS